MGRFEHSSGLFFIGMGNPLGPPLMGEGENRIEGHPQTPGSIPLHLCHQMSPSPLMGEDEGGYKLDTLVTHSLNT